MSALSQKRFQECLDAYGALREHWPESDRPLFDHFAGRPETALLIASAQQLDYFLDEWQPDASRADALAHRILLAAPGDIAGPAARANWHLRAFLIAAFVLLGFGNGYFTQTDLPDASGNELIFAGMEEGDL